MKFRSSSGGCKSRPVKAKPRRPVVSLAPGPATAPAMRRHTSEWAAESRSLEMGKRPERREGREPRRLQRLHPDSGRGSSRARRGYQPRHARRRRSRNLGDPPRSAGVRGLRGAAPESPRDVRPRAQARLAPGNGRRRSVRQAVGRRRGKTGAEAEGGVGVGGPNTSEDVGERLATGPGRAKAARVETSFRRET